MCCLALAAALVRPLWFDSFWLDSLALQMLGLLVVLGIGMAAACLLILWSCRLRHKR